MRVKHRSFIAIILLNFITLGLYQIYWFFITKTEMNTLNSKDVKVPFFLWFFIPIINIWWFYRFAKAIERTTKNKLNKWSAFFAPVLIGLMISVLLTILGNLPTIDLPIIGATAVTSYVVISATAGIIPILYYQSYLNKVSR